jgi:hypothetical protein
MAVKNRADLTTLLTNNITDALNRQNTAAKVREVIQDVIDSCLNSIDDAASPTTIYSTTVTIPSADVLTMNTTPVELIPSAGDGKAIICFDTTTLTSLFGTTAYATNTDVEVYTKDSTDVQLFFSGGINNNGADKTMRGSVQTASGASDLQIIANKPIMASVKTGNPTAGDGDIVFNLQYIIIDL